MTTIGYETAIRYLIFTALFITSAKVLLLTIKHIRIKFFEHHINQRKRLFTKLYSGVNPKIASINYRKDNDIKSDNYVYGEILFTPFAEQLHIVNPKPGEIFYDLGCGGGKAVFATAALYDQLEIHGIEILDALYNICIDQLNAYYAQPNVYKATSIEFHLADFLEYDFSDGNIIFVNATSLERKLWAKLVKKLELLPKGARVLVTTKTITSNQFTLIHAGGTLMSWGYTNIRIYQKVK